MHLSTPDVVVGGFFGERPHNARLLEFYQEEPRPLVPVPVLPDHDRAAIRGPRDDQRIVGGLREAERGRGAVGGRGEDVGRRTEPRQAPHDPTSVRRDLCAGQDRYGEQRLEVTKTRRC